MSDKRTGLTMAVLTLLVFGYGFIDGLRRPDRSALHIAAIIACAVAVLNAIRHIYPLTRQPDA